jgi:hypothetical protein
MDPTVNVMRRWGALMVFFSEIFTRYNGNMMGKMNENDD